MDKQSAPEHINPLSKTDDPALEAPQKAPQKSPQETHATASDSEAPRKQPAKEGKRFGISKARHIVQIALLVLFALPIVCALWVPFGLTPSNAATMGTPAQLPFYGSLSSSTIGPVQIVDVFAGLQVILASKSLPVAMLIGMVPVLIVYGLIRGRVFCGWVCPVNLLMEAVDYLRQRLNIKVKESPIPRHTKIWIAAAVLVLSLVFSVPVYEIFNPIGAINKFIAFGSLAGILTLIAIILVELFWGHRTWCRSICPLGGFYEVVGKVGLVNVQLDHTACINCNKCKTVCICDPVILEPTVDGQDTIVRAGDCMLCGKCVDVCPTQALKIAIGRSNK